MKIVVLQSQPESLGRRRADSPRNEDSVTTQMCILIFAYKGIGNPRRAFAVTIVFTDEESAEIIVRTLSVFLRLLTIRGTILKHICKGY